MFEDDSSGSEDDESDDGSGDWVMPFQGRLDHASEFVDHISLEISQARDRGWYQGLFRGFVVATVVLACLYALVVGSATLSGEGCDGDSWWPPEPFRSIAQRDKALKVASESYWTSVLTPDLNARVASYRIAPVWAAGGLLVAIIQVFGTPQLAGLCAAVGLVVTGRALPNLWQASSLFLTPQTPHGHSYSQGGPVPNSPWEVAWSSQMGSFY